MTTERDLPLLGQHIACKLSSSASEAHAGSPVEVDLLCLLESVSLEVTIRVEAELARPRNAHSVLSLIEINHLAFKNVVGIVHIRLVAIELDAVEIVAVLHGHLNPLAMNLNTVLLAGLGFAFDVNLLACFQPTEHLLFLANDQNLAIDFIGWDVHRRR